MRRWELVTLAITMAMSLAGCGAAAGGDGSGASGSPASPVDGQLTLLARDIAFTPGTVTMTADTALTVVLDNQDAGVPHDVVLKGGAGEGIELGKTEIVTGVDQAQFSIPPLIPGTYRFTCTVHPNMVTALTVVPAT